MTVAAAKLEKQLAELARTGADGCGCDYWIVDAGAEKLVKLPAPVSWAAELQIRCELGNGTTLLAKRSCLQEIGPLDEQLQMYEDWDWMLRFTRRFAYTVVTEPLARVHVSGEREAWAFARSAERFLELHDADFHGADRGIAPTCGASITVMSPETRSPNGSSG